MTKVKTSVAGRTETAGVSKGSGKVKRDEREVVVTENKDNKNGKDGQDERATDEAQQRQDTSEKYGSGCEDRSGGGHERCTALGGQDANARKELVKGFDERHGEANTDGEEKENET